MPSHRGMARYLVSWQLLVADHVLSLSIYQEGVWFQASHLDLSLSYTKVKGKETNAHISEVV